MLKANEAAGTYFVTLHPTEVERRRIMLTLFLLPLAMAYGRTLHRDEATKELLKAAKRVYLSRMADQDEVVRCGDLVIWRVDRTDVLSTLRECYTLLLADSDFAQHQIRYGLLAHSLSFARNDILAADLRTALEKSPEGDFQETTKLLFQYLSISFTRQVLDIDPSRPGITNDEIVRLQVSITLAVPIVRTVFWEVSDVLKKMKT